MTEITVTRTDGKLAPTDTAMPADCQTCPSREGWGCLQVYRGIESAWLECGAVCVGGEHYHAVAANENEQCCHCRNLFAKGDKAYFFFDEDEVDTFLCVTCAKELEEQDVHDIDESEDEIRGLVEEQDINDLPTDQVPYGCTNCGFNEDGICDEYRVPCAEAISTECDRPATRDCAKCGDCANFFWSLYDAQESIIADFERGVTPGEGCCDVATSKTVTPEQTACDYFALQPMLL